MPIVVGRNCKRSSFSPAPLSPVGTEGKCNAGSGGLYFPALLDVTRPPVPPPIKGGGNSLFGWYCLINPYDVYGR